MIHTFSGDSTMQADGTSNTMGDKGAFRSRDEGGVGFPADRTALLVIDR